MVDGVQRKLVIFHPEGGKQSPAPRTASESNPCQVVFRCHTHVHIFGRAKARASMTPANLSLEQDGRLPSGRCKLACDECRKRKLRCDGQDPQCGVCTEAGITCRVNTKRSTRGPKKGLLRALRIKAGKSGSVRREKPSLTSCAIIAELQRRLDESEVALAVYDDRQDDTQAGLDSEIDTTRADVNAGPSTNTSSPVHHGAQSPSRRDAEVPAAPSQGRDLISDFTSAEL
jgi:hypothetical protein